MNHKQKVIDKCREHSSKALTMGCEVLVKNGLFVRTFGLSRPLFVNNHGRVTNETSYVDVGQFKIWVDEGDAEIIGHPPGIPQLLQALQDKDGHAMIITLRNDTLNLGDVKLPITHHTLSEIPESDPCWVGISHLLNLD